MLTATFFENQKQSAQKIVINLRGLFLMRRFDDAVFGSFDVRFSFACLLKKVCIQV
jgi:hypothetical protein